MINVHVILPSRDYSVSYTSDILPSCKPLRFIWHLQQEEKTARYIDPKTPCKQVIVVETVISNVLIKSMKTKYVMIILCNTEIHYEIVNNYPVINI